MKGREIIIVSLILLIFSFLVRFPYFFPAVLDWDESTYILMAQSVLDGHLPYTELWDNKPPFIFYIVGSFIYFFGKSIVAVRVGGTICLAVSSFFIYLIAKKIWNSKLIAFTASGLFIFASTSIQSGEATISEHIAHAFLIPAIYLFFTELPPTRKYFLSGILITAATLVRMNLAFVGAGYGIFIFIYYLYRRQIKVWLAACLSFILGIFLVLTISILPYLLSGRIEIWLSSVLYAPLAYSTSQYSLVEILGFQCRFIYYYLSHIQQINSFVALVITLGIIGLVVIILQIKKMSESDQARIAFLIIILLFTELSILKSGAFWSPYMIQLLPVLCIFSASLVIYVRSIYARFTAAILASVFLVFMSKDIIFQYKIMVPRYQREGKLRHGPAYEIVSYIEENQIPKNSILLFTQHIAYWFLNEKPFDKVITHPSNIHLNFLLEHINENPTSPLEEMHKLLLEKPEIIVVPENYIHYVNPSADSLLQKELGDHYYLVKGIPESWQSTYIFRRLQE
jgi:4-amino-4-deoxy-L-arabinose transferase-like glycosyltransferase